MRVVLDARPLQSASGGRGIGRYIRELVPRLAARSEVERVILHLDGRRPLPTGLPPGEQAAVARPGALPGPASLGDRYLGTGALDAWSPDLYHATLLPPPRLPARVATVMTIHDLIPLLAPGSVPARASLVFRLAFGQAGHCQRVITVSRFTARCVGEHLGLPREKVVVTPLGVDAHRFAPAADGSCPPWPRPYLLHVGGFDREKNLGLLLEIMDRLGRLPEGARFSLVVVGEGGREARALESRVWSRGMAERVILAGHLDEADLCRTYAGASLFLFPSRWEGFGLPPLEAMAAGCPVLASHAASLPEVVGESGCLLTPDDPRPWVREVVRLSGDPAARVAMVRSGRERAARFTWEATAEATLRAYGEALEVA
jgi:alpha-1,3-rhamnosyl/mannosyltransferase